ncbi:MAG: hypothetical protein GWN71_16745, partial [Gammaproteobacteria bacterium]|nr:hypothetical protein [Gammaproteobacteria bacterium]
MSTAMRDRHLTDAELFRLLDTGDTEPARTELARHVEGCDRCAEALRSLESDSRLISRFLEDADFEDGG